MAFEKCSASGWCGRTAITLLFVCSPVSASANNGLPPLTLTQAVERALAAHPAIKEADLKYAAEKHRQALVAQGTPWELDVEVENALGSGEASGFDIAETTVGFNKIVELGDKRERRRSLGQARLALSDSKRRATEIESGLAVAQAFLSTLSEQHRATLKAASVETAMAIQHSVSRRVSVGRAADAELVTAEIALARAEIQSRASERALQAQRNRLAILLGDARPTFGTVKGELFSLRNGSFAPNQGEHLEDNPELRLLSLETQVRRQQLRLSESHNRPDVTIGAGVRHLAESDDAALMFSLSLPFGQSQRAKPAIEAARLEETAAPFAVSNRRRMIGASLELTAAELASKAEQLTTLQERIIPAAKRAIALYQDGFELGRYSLFELTAAQQTLLEAELDAIDAAERYHLTAFERQALIGHIPGLGEQR